MNGGDLTVNPWAGFEYHYNGFHIEIPPIMHESQAESFYRAVDAAMDIIFQAETGGE